MKIKEKFQEAIEMPKKAVIISMMALAMAFIALIIGMVRHGSWFD